MKSLLLLVFVASAFVGLFILQSPDAADTRGDHSPPAIDQSTSTVPDSSTRARETLASEPYTPPAPEVIQPDPKKTEAMQGWLKSEMGVLTRELATATKAPAEVRDEQIEALMAAFKARAQAAYRKK